LRPHDEKPDALPSGLYSGSNVATGIDYRRNQAEDFGIGA
jgi:hypothetical protein